MIILDQIIYPCIPSLCVESEGILVTFHVSILCEGALENRSKLLVLQSSSDESCLSFRVTISILFAPLCK